VHEGEVGHGVGAGGAGAQRVEVGQLAAQHLDAAGGEGVGGGRGASEADDLMSCREQFGRHGGSDPAGCSGDEDAHDALPSWCQCVTSG
jgi:hypothetical protein